MASLAWLIEFSSQALFAKGTVKSHGASECKVHSEPCQPAIGLPPVARTALLARASGPPKSTPLSVHPTGSTPSQRASTPNGIRTRVTALKGRRPGPLDDGGSIDRGEGHYQDRSHVDPSGLSWTSHVVSSMPEPELSLYGVGLGEASLLAGEVAVLHEQVHERPEQLGGIAHRLGGQVSRAPRSSPVAPLGPGRARPTGSGRPPSSTTRRSDRAQRPPSLPHPQPPLQRGTLASCSRTA